MSVRNCVFPWHWMLIDQHGDVMPCSHGSLPVGNIREHSPEAVWNGPVMQDVRRHLLRGEPHPVCATASCPFQHAQPSFPVRTVPLQVEEAIAEGFDEAWYLATYPEVRRAVEDLAFASGLEHFIRHGRQDGYGYRLRWKSPEAPPLHNAELALVEYSRGATELTATPVDLVVCVTNVCNLKCGMCPHGMGLLPNGGHMAAEFIDRLAPFLHRSSRMFVSGIGEPTFAPGFWNIVDRLAGRTDIAVRIHSNGHFLTPENADRILNSGLREISFSLDAATSGTYARIRGGDYARARRGIATLVERRRARGRSHLKILLNMTLMKENLAEAGAFVALGRELGVDVVVFTQLMTFGDRPDWRVPRRDWTFVYSEQMPGRYPEEMRQSIAEIRHAAALLDVAVELRENVSAYAAEAELPAG